MGRKVTLVVPEAPVPATAAGLVHRKLSSGGFRLGILDNSKGNADHLLRFLVEGLKTWLPVSSVVTLRKASPAQGAPKDILDQLTADADVVISAMAD